MTIFPDILRCARDAYHNLQDDDIMKNIFNSGRNKNKVGMRIPAWMITDEMQLMEHYKMYCQSVGLDHLAAEEIKKLVEYPANVVDSLPTRHDETSYSHDVNEVRAHGDMEKSEVENSLGKVRKRLQWTRRRRVLKGTDIITDSKCNWTMLFLLLVVASADPLLQQQDISIWLALQMKFKKTQVPQTACRSSVVRTRDHDDPHDDAHPKGENSEKRQKTSEYEAYVSGESSYGQVNVEEPGPSTSGNQEQDNEFDLWTDS
ncbi:hypothetical protein Tco_1203367 [Tanacetum coccineum]